MTGKKERGRGEAGRPSEQGRGEAGRPSEQGRASGVGRVGQPEAVRAAREGGPGWVAFAGGELEGRPAAARCASCRTRPAEEGTEATRQVLCFECHQADLKRQRAIKAAGDLDTASEARFQAQLPFEPVNRPRLYRLRAERATIRAGAAAGAGRFEVRRRQAQIAARREWQRVVPGVRARGSVTPEESRVFAAAIRAAELQLPESWLPFVVAR